MDDDVMKRVTRRRFLKIMAMAGATAGIDWHSIDVLAGSMSDKKDYPVVVIGATPLTNLYYTGNPRGAIYGFSRPLEQLNALDVRSPLKGLYMAGAWTHGGGCTPVMMAGRQAAEALLADWKNEI